MNSRILIAYYTKGGASEEYAKIIAETITANGLNVDIFNLRDKIPDIEPYEIIVLGTGVRMFRVYGRWKKILKQKTLSSKHLFMFLSSGTAIEEPDKAVDKFLRPLVERFGLKPKSLVSFPGLIPEKWAKDEDQKETMKPDVAKEWAKEIASQVQI